MKQLVVILILLATPSVVVAEIHHVLVFLTGYEGIADGYSPADLTVSEDDTVIWDMSSTAHKLLSGDKCYTPNGFWNSGPVPKGSSYSIVFDTSFLAQYPVANDKYIYYCSFDFCLTPLPSVTVVRSVPTHRSTWGRIKSLFQ